MERSFGWEFEAPSHVYGGLDFPVDLDHHLPICATLFVTTSGFTKRGVTRIVEELFISKGISYVLVDAVSPNPSFSEWDSILNLIGNFRPLHILALGGGSVIDVGKILSWLLAEGAPSPQVTLDMIVNGYRLPEIDPVPLTACPTTAGTGSEVTPFATVWDMKAKKKFSFCSPKLHPRTVLLFVSLTCSMPWDITLSTGLDALSQCFESVWNRNSSPVTSALASRGIALVFENLPILESEPFDSVVREKMMVASLMSGLCIANTRTAMAHSVSYPLTAHLGMAHGVACSFMLPDLWDYNFGVDDGRMAVVACALNSSPFEMSERIACFMDNLRFRDVFRKSCCNVSRLLELAPEMQTSGRSENSLRKLDGSDLDFLLEKAALRWI